MSMETSVKVSHTKVGVTEHKLVMTQIIIPISGSAIPPGGDEGQVLTKVAGAPKWRNVDGGTFN